MGILNIINEEIDKFGDNGTPKIFSHTIYRLPTEEELVDVDKYNLNADEIINGFTYTLVGRGFKTKPAKFMIYRSIELLSEKFPENEEYEKALYKITH